MIQTWLDVICQLSSRIRHRCHGWPARASFACLLLAALACNCVGNRPALQSNEVLDREQQAEAALVKHILIGWRDLEKYYDTRMDPRARQRHEGEANALVREIVGKLENGMPIEALMVEYSEDPGSQGGRAYEVRDGDSKAREFRALSLRLQVGEIGVVRTRFGWHIVKRIQ